MNSTGSAGSGIGSGIAPELAAEFDIWLLACVFLINAFDNCYYNTRYMDVASSLCKVQPPLCCVAERLIAASDRQPGRSDNMAHETVRLAEYAAALRYEDLPEAVVQRAKECIADTVAAGICGAAMPWSRIVIDYAERTGPGGKCRILGRDGPAVQAPSAAL